MKRLAILLFVGACAPAQSPSPDRPSRPDPTPGRGPKDTVPPESLTSTCDDAPLRTLEELLDSTSASERIAIDVVPAVQGGCTLLACDHECCNHCGGDYRAEYRRERQPQSLYLRFTNLTGCAGMDCNFHCEPFGLAPTTRYRFVGTVTFEESLKLRAVYRQPVFAVEKYCRLP